MRARLIRILLIILLLPALLSAAAGWTGAWGFLHPQKRAFTADMVRDADVTFARIGAHREDFNVTAPDGVTLRGWKVRAARGPKELWRVPGALHTGAMGTAPQEFRRRVITFFDSARLRPSGPAPSGLHKPG